MRKALLLVFAALLVVPLRAEDWKTTDGKTYKDVKVLSHDAAYVTILHQDGGGRILLSTLNPDLQKRFGYDPVKAAAAIAATAAADQRDKDALAREKSQSQAQAAQGQGQLTDAIAYASLPPPPSPPDNSQPQTDGTSTGTPDQTEIDDYSGGSYDDGYGAYGYGYGYGGYGGYGYRHAGSRGWGNRSAPQGSYTGGAPATRQMSTGGRAPALNIGTAYRPQATGTTAAPAHR